MKITKILGIAAVALLANIAGAASVDWSTAALSFGETSLKKNTDVAGYLVYLSSGSLASTYTIDDSFSAASVGTVITGASDTDGANKGGLLTGTLNVTDLGYNNGDSFALVLSYKSEGKTYWNISSTVNTLSGLDDTDPRINPTDWTDFAVSSTVAGETGKASGGSGWTAVPEPSTAALALAGLALLLKRRKA